MLVKVKAGRKVVQGCLGRVSYSADVVPPWGLLWETVLLKELGVQTVHPGSAWFFSFSLPASCLSLPGLWL